MNFGKLILASCTFGPIGYGAGWVAGVIIGSPSPSQFGIGGAAITTLLVYLFAGSNNATVEGEEATEEPLHNLGGYFDVVDRDLFVDN